MTKKITSIEVLRTIGWFGVFLCHFKGAFLNNVRWITDNTPLSFIYSGNAYVRLLFVISGLVISYKYFANSDFTDFKADVAKRYFRLLPPIVVAEAAVFCFMRFGCLRNFEVAKLVGSESFLGIFNQFEPNFLTMLKEAFATTYLTGANGYIGPLWTMQYEYLGAIYIMVACCLLSKSYLRYVFYFVNFVFYSNYYTYFVVGMFVSDLIVSDDIKTLFDTHKVFHVVFTLIGYLLMSCIFPNDSDKTSRVFFAVGIIIFLLGIIYSSTLDKIGSGRFFTWGGGE